MSLIGKVLMSVAIAAFTVIPPIADLATTTHVFHPDWTPHARLHTVWLLGTSSSIGVVSLYILWFGGFTAEARVMLAGTLALCVLGGFFVAAATIGFYGGALSDPQGGIEKSDLGIDGNLAVFSSATLVLLTGWFLCRRSRSGD
jgi:hypothetical protein